MKEDSRVVTITSGTPAVLGFTPDRRKGAGKQFVDCLLYTSTPVEAALLYAIWSVTHYQHNHKLLPPTFFLFLFSFLKLLVYSS